MPRCCPHYGVVADPARVGDPNRKGSVENAVKYTQDTALKGRKFEDIETQNEWLKHWEERWAARRIHGRAKRQVEEMYQEEKPHLMPLPLSPFVYFRQETRTVYDDGTIQVDNCYYAARPAPLYSEVVVRIYDETDRNPRSTPNGAYPPPRKEQTTGFFEHGTIRADLQPVPANR